MEGNTFLRLFSRQFNSLFGTDHVLRLFWQMERPLADSDATKHNIVAREHGVAHDHKLTQQTLILHKQYFQREYDVILLFNICAHVSDGHLLYRNPAAFVRKLTWVALADWFWCEQKHWSIFHVITVSVCFRVSIHFWSFRHSELELAHKNNPIEAP